jgi:nucleotide-binding universal stress UspA family protein
VLLTTDGSVLAADAMEKGLNLLGKGHRLVALTVVAPASPALSLSPMGPGPDPTLADELEARTTRVQSGELHSLLDRLGVDAEARVEVGDAGDTICLVAEEIGADVVVVGSHGNGRLKEILLGSVSHHVLHHAPCPVLTVRS